MDYKVVVCLGKEPSDQHVVRPNAHIPNEKDVFLFPVGQEHYKCDKHFRHNLMSVLHIDICYRIIEAENYYLSSHKLVPTSSRHCF